MDVKYKCTSCRYLPALIFYRQSTAGESAASPLPAESGSSWATMAVRCAAGGGISSSTPGVSKLPAAGAAPIARGAANRAVTAAKTAEVTAALARTRLSGAPAVAATAIPGSGRATTTADTALAKRGPGACHNCDDPNHESRDCPKPCRECGSDKHRIGFHYRTGIKTSKCFNCEGIGHESRDCPAPCGICGSSQHKSGYHLNDHLYVGKAEPPADAKAPADAKPPAKAPAAAQSAATKGSSRGSAAANASGGSARAPGGRSKGGS